MIVSLSPHNSANVAFVVCMVRALQHLTYETTNKADGGYVAGALGLFGLAGDYLA